MTVCVLCLTDVPLYACALGGRGFIRTVSLVDFRAVLAKQPNKFCLRYRQWHQQSVKCLCDWWSRSWNNFLDICILKRVFWGSAAELLEGFPRFPFIWYWPAVWELLTWGRKCFRRSIVFACVSVLFFAIYLLRYGRAESITRTKEGFSIDSILNNKISSNMFDAHKTLQSWWLKRSRSVRWSLCVCSPKFDATFAFLTTTLSEEFMIMPDFRQWTKAARFRSRPLPAEHSVWLKLILRHS